MSDPNSYTARLNAVVKSQSGDPMSDRDAESVYELALEMAEKLDRSGGPSRPSWIVRGRHVDVPHEQYIFLRGGQYQRVGVYACDKDGIYWTYDVPDISTATPQTAEEK